MNPRPFIGYSLVLMGAACASIGGLNQYSSGACAGGCDESTESGAGATDAIDDFETGPEVDQAAADGNGIDAPPDGQLPNDARLESSTADASINDSSGEGATTDAANPDASRVADASRMDAVAGDAAAVDAADGGSAPNCTGDLSNIGTADFRVSFTVTTQTTNYVALVNQRSGCTGNSFWDLRYRASTSQIAFEIDDNSVHDVQANTAAVTLNDGLPHAVVFFRMSGTLTVEVDGVVVGTVTGGNVPLLSFGALPALAEGVDSCDNHDGTLPLDGTITQVCVSH